MSEKEQWLSEEQDSSCDSDKQFTFQSHQHPAASALLDVTVTLKHIRTGKLTWRVHRTGVWVVEIFRGRGRAPIRAIFPGALGNWGRAGSSKDEGPASGHSAALTG